MREIPSGCCLLGSSVGGAAAVAAGDIDADGIAAAEPPQLASRGSWAMIAAVAAANRGAAAVAAGGERCGADGADFGFGYQTQLAPPPTAGAGAAGRQGLCSHRRR